MRALTYEGPEHIAVSEVDDAVLPGPEGAVVRVTMAGICGSDLHIYHGHGFTSGDTGRRSSAGASERAQPSSPLLSPPSSATGRSGPDGHGFTSGDTGRRSSAGASERAQPSSPLLSPPSSATGRSGPDGHGFTSTTGYSVGHEAVGEVVEVGPEVRRFSVGDRVLVSAAVACPRCQPCAHGHVILCESGAAGCYGLGHDLPGCQAEALAVPAADRNLELLPEGLSDEAGLVLTDNLPTAWYGARRGRVGPGDTVAVVGLGPVGLLSVLSAQVMGAGRVLAIDLVPERRERAAALGAEPVEGDDVRAAVKDLTGGRGVDVALEAVGADETITLAMDVAGREGRVSIVGVNQNMDFRMRMVLAQLKCLEIHIGLCSVQHELPTLMRLATSGRIDPGVVVTHTFDLADGPDAYALFAARTDGVGKVVLKTDR